MTEIAVSAGRTTMCAAVVDIESVKLTVSDRFNAVPPIDVESVNDTNSSRFAVPPIDVESVKLTVSDRFAVPPIDVESVNDTHSSEDSQFLLLMSSLSIITNSVRFAVPPIDVESVKLTNSWKIRSSSY